MGFLLVAQFAMMPFTSAIEPLRAANRLSGTELYRWRLYSVDGAPVEASSGIPIMPHQALGPTSWPHMVFVCSSLGGQYFDNRVALGWLREQAHRGIPIGAISSGSHILARAGLLKGYRCTIHWEDFPSFHEAFPDIEVTDRVFEIDRDRYTCAGGTAALDMMLSIIAMDHGRELAAAVSDQFIHDRVRTPGDHQRMGHRVRLRAKSPKLDAAIQLMETNMEPPLALTEIAGRIEVSTRHLERLFEKHFGCSPRHYYMVLRLEHARLLLLRTRMSIMDIALAAGFVSPSHFTRSYREYFGRTPTSERDTAV